MGNPRGEYGAAGVVRLCVFEKSACQLPHDAVRFPTQTGAL
jgi:hypothetical protein